MIGNQVREKKRMDYFNDLVETVCSNETRMGFRLQGIVKGKRTSNKNTITCNILLRRGDQIEIPLV